MRLHGKARICLHSRLLNVELVLEQGWTVAAAAEAAGISERTAAKWLARFRGEGRDGLRDRFSAPHRIPRRTPAGRVRVIELLRRLYDRGRDRRGAADAALDRLRGAEADRPR